MRWDVVCLVLVFARPGASFHTRFLLGHSGVSRRARKDWERAAPSRLKRFALLASTTSPSPALPTFEDAMEAAVRGDWRRASHSFATVVSTRPPHVRECNKFLRLLGDAGRIQDAVTAYEAMVRAGVKPTLVTFSTMISRAGANRRARVALRFYHEMRRQGVRPDAQAMNSLINAFAKVGLVDEALAVLAEMTEAGVPPTLITFNSMIDACARVGDIKRAVEVFGWIPQWGLVPNERTYSILVHSCARAGAVDDAFQILSDMRAAELHPNKVTWTTLIDACGRAGQLERAFGALSDMTAAGLEPNVVTWTSLIDACGKHRDLRTGFDLFLRMGARGVRPNGVTCSALMHASLRAGEVDLAFAVLAHMHDTGLRPTQVTYTMLLNECARLGLADRAARVLKQMREDPTTPLALEKDSRSVYSGSESDNDMSSGASSSAVSGGASSSGISSSASSSGVGSRASSSGNRSSASSSGSSSSATSSGNSISGATDSSAARTGYGLTSGSVLEPLRANDASVAAASTAVAARSGRSGSSSSAGSSSSGGSISSSSGGSISSSTGDQSGSVGRGLELQLLRLFGQAQRVDDALRLLESMVARHELPDAEAWQTLFRAVGTGQQFDHAVGLLRRLKAKGQPLGVSDGTYEALLEACGRVGRLTQAVLAVREFEDLGVQPTEGACVALLEACRAARDGGAAVDVFEMMRKAGVRPGVRSWTSLMKAISDSGSGSGGGNGGRGSGSGGRIKTVSSDNSARQRLADSQLAKRDAGEPSSAGKAPGAAVEEEPGVVAQLSNVAGTPLPQQSRQQEVVYENESSPVPLSAALTSAGAAAEAAPQQAALDNLFRVFLVFQEMRNAGVVPDRYAYNALINTCAKIGEFDRAMQVLRDMVNEDGIQPDVVTYTSLLKAAANAAPAARADEAEELFCAMQQRTNHFSTFRAPNEHTYGHLMKANLLAGRHSRVLELWAEMVAAGVAPGARTSGAALAAAKAADSVALALEIYGAMRRVGVRPDNRGLLHLHSLLKAHGLHSLASQLLRERSAVKEAAAGDGERRRSMR